MSSTPARYFPGTWGKDREANLINRESAQDTSAEAERPSLEQGVPDEDLVARLQGKDVEALDLLYRRYARLVYSICFRILRDSTEAEDLVHEVFLCLYWRCRSFDRRKGTARCWIIQLAYSKCFDWRDHLRARHGKGREADSSVGARSSIQDLPAQGPDPSYFVLWNPSMVAAFKSLSREQQEALRLFYFGGYTFKEIADEKGYSYGNVKHHVYRGIERLRQLVYDGGGRKAPEVATQGLQCESEGMVR